MQTTQSTPITTIQSPAETSGLSVKTHTPKQSVFFVVQSILEQAERGDDLNAMRGVIVDRLDKVISWESQLRDLDDDLHEVSISHPRTGARYP